MKKVLIVAIMVVIALGLWAEETGRSLKFSVGGGYTNSWLAGKDTKYFEDDEIQSVGGFNISISTLEVNNKMPLLVRPFFFYKTKGFELLGVKQKIGYFGAGCKILINPDKTKKNHYLFPFVGGSVSFLTSAKAEYMGITNENKESYNDTEICLDFGLMLLLQQKISIDIYYEKGMSEIFNEDLRLKNDSFNLVLGLWF